MDDGKGSCADSHDVDSSALERSSFLSPKYSDHSKVKTHHDMPSVYESKSLGSGHSNVNVQDGDMPTGFEAEPGVKPEMKIIHTEMMCM